MTKRKRVHNVLAGLLMLMAALILALFPDEGYIIVAAILSVSLFLYAARKLLYYFTMARCMIGGSMILCKGLIFLDLSFFVFSLNKVPQVYVMLYLIAGLLFSGGVDVLRALESRKLKASSWKRKLAQGSLTLILSVICLFQLQSAHFAVYVFCLNLAQSAISRIAEAFRKTAIIYIP